MHILKKAIEKFGSIKTKDILGLFFVASFLSIGSAIYSYSFDVMLAYGDAESHLNIAKRVTHSLTPGLAQLGGIWLPLPHILMLPFTFFDTLWRTGFAGAIVSGISFIVSSIYIYKFLLLLTHKKIIGFLAALIFMTNPNILYMQTTAMTELPLIMFFILSSYYLVNFLLNDYREGFLLASAFFGLLATLTRYDGWFLVIIEALILAVYFVWKGMLKRKIFVSLKRMEGLMIIFATLAFFGIFLWIGWDFLILGDPLYFTNSPFSAKSQQQGWLSKGMLLTYNNATLSFNYYMLASYENIGKIISLTSIVGFLTFILYKPSFQKILISLLLLFAVVFYFVTLYLGQSVIFIPSLTPDNFEWQLFNVRYGLMMVPAAAIFSAYLIYLFFRFGKIVGYIGVLILLSLALLQTSRFLIGNEKIVTLEDGINGLSSASTSSAQDFIREEYDNGLILIDDYARTISIIRTGIPMENTIYVGNKPYWDESLEQPEKYAKWIVMQKNDAVWKALFERPEKQARLYKYFEKVYTSDEILVFKKNSLYATN